MNQLVKNLLALNQLEFWDEYVEFSRFDITQVIQGVLQSMDILASPKRCGSIFVRESRSMCGR